MSEVISKTKEDIKIPWLWIGLILTALVLVLAIVVGRSEICAWDGVSPAGCISRWKYFLKSPPNEIGDTLAGFAGALAFVWLIVTVGVQSQELKEQRKEFMLMNATMAGQRFETTFFGLLSTYSEIVDSIDLVNAETNVTSTGRDCFRVFYTRLNKLYRKKVQAGHSESDAMEMAYTNFWKMHQLELGHYFRFLFNVFRFLSESSGSEETKQQYARLLRSQLSDQELLIIFYNCISPQGKEFLKYSEEYAIFDNLPTVRLLNFKHSNLVRSGCFGSNPMLQSKDMRHSINKGKGPRNETPH